MLYFNTISRISTILIINCIVFFILTIVFFLSSSFPEILKHNFTNDVRGTIFTVIALLISIFSLSLGIVLKYIARDANFEIKLLEQRLKDELDRIIS